MTSEMITDSNEKLQPEKEVLPENSRSSSTEQPKIIRSIPVECYFFSFINAVGEDYDQSNSCR